MHMLYAHIHQMHISHTCNLKNKENGMRVRENEEYLLGLCSGWCGFFLLLFIFNSLWGTATQLPNNHLEIYYFL